MGEILRGVHRIVVKMSKKMRRKKKNYPVLSAEDTGCTCRAKNTPFKYHIITHYVPCTYHITTHNISCPYNITTHYFPCIYHITTHYIGIAACRNVGCTKNIPPIHTILRPIISYYYLFDDRCKNTIFEPPPPSQHSSLLLPTPSC